MNSDQTIAWIVIGIFCTLVLIIAAMRHQVMKNTPSTPRTGPNSGPPPAVNTRLTPHIGASMYTAPVRAMTPAGISVRQSKCCRNGHKTPAQAVAHAKVVADRIRRTGR